MIRRDELIRIGRFNKPHGIHGELSFTFTDDVFDESDASYLVCEIEGIFVPFFIESYRFRSDTTALVKLEEIDSAEEAADFTNRDVYFPKRYLPDDTVEAPGDYFIGFRIVDEEQGELGTVAGLDDTTENVLFIVDRRGAELLIPVADEFISGIDEGTKTLFVRLPEGLLHLND